MASFAKFSQRIRLRGKKLESNVSRAMRATALAVDREVVIATPVDTGQARSNWIVSIGTPRSSVIQPYAPHPKGSKGSGQATSEGQNASAALNQGAAAIATHKGTRDIYIQNNVDYIGKLNRNHSPQAPANFVQTAAAVGVRTVKRNLKSILS